MGKSVNQVIHLLALIDRKEEVNLDTWLDVESELAENIDTLLEWGFVDKENNEYVLTNKGKNTLNYFNQRKKEEHTYEYIYSRSP